MNLVPPNWVPVANQPVVRAGNLCLTNLATNDTQFDRLHRP